MTSKVQQYNSLAEKIQYAVSDTKIFELTGCLANCDKYHYKAYPRSDLDAYYSNVSSFQVSFLIPNGHNEVKEQVGKSICIIWLTRFITIKR